MRKHLSVLGLAARGAVGRILLITVLTAALAGALLYLVPAQSDSFTSMEVDSVVSLSEAVIKSVPSLSSKRKQSRMGNEFLELITRLIACK